MASGAPIGAHGVGASPDAGSIALHRPTLGGRELGYLLEVIESGQLAGGGSFSARVEQLLGDALAGCRVLLTTSGTHALELAALLVGVGPGDEVIVPTFTFPSTANAFLLRGARVVFADIRPDTLNIDEELLESLVSPRTRVVVPVHYGGVGCEMDRIAKLADRHGFEVVEDSAHGVFGAYKGRPLGTLGRLGILSFHETKNFTCGEGGALVCSDVGDAERGVVMREKGTDRARFTAGLVDKYTWWEHGSSYCPSELLAAILLGQLEQRQLVQTRRRTIWDRYHRELAGWALDQGARLPFVPIACEPAYHLFHVVLPHARDTERFISHVRSFGVAAAWHFLPLHSTPAGRRAAPDSWCPVADDVAARLVRIPLFHGLTDDEVDRVIEAVTTWRAST